MYHFNWACPVSPMCLNSWFLLWNFLWHMVHDSTGGAAAVLAFCFSRLAASLRCLFDSAGWLCSSSLSGPAEAVLAPAASGLCVALVPFWSAAGPGPGSGWAVPACAGSSAAQTSSGTAAGHTYVLDNCRGNGSAPVASALAVPFAWGCSSPCSLSALSASDASPSLELASCKHKLLSCSPCKQAIQGQHSHSTMSLITVPWQR